MPQTPNMRRRDLLQGRACGPNPEVAESHVSSVIVHARPEAADAVALAVAAWPGVEVHARDPRGKLIVTLETGSDSEIVERLNALQNLPGVLSTMLVFHHYEPAPP